MPDSKSVYLAVDLGAGSGRVIAGVLQGDKLSLEEINRFENKPFEKNGGLYWDFESLWEGIIEGLKRSVETYSAEMIRSIGVDTWGVDYGLLDKDGQLLGGPRHYRDERTSGAMEKVFSQVSEAEVFEETGLQFMEINTLFQLAVEAKDGESRLKDAEQFLLIPDLINHRLTGKAYCERTNASTTQFYNPVEKDWSKKLFGAVEVPLEVTPELIAAGESLGGVLPGIREATGIGEATEVVTVGSHDTASAVAAVPADAGTRFAYLSSGTWSLLGVELDKPVMTPLVHEYNFTNEVGVFDTIRLLKNINGLWLVQECRRIWNEQGRDLSYADLAGMSREVEPLTSFVDPDSERFGRRANMPQMIRDFCRETGQHVPDGPAEIVRLIADSLAMKVRFTLGRLEELIGHQVEILHIIGGGGQDEMLNQSIANSINRPVVVGPYEATAAGNLMMQMVACGELSTFEEGRAMIRDSFETKRFEPEAPEKWDEAYERFKGLL
ncbi:MAG: rhamnulokinase [Verrucomicrobiaceae bacterium]